MPRSGSAERPAPGRCMRASYWRHPRCLSGDNCRGGVDALLPRAPPILDVTCLGSGRTIPGSGDGADLHVAALRRRLCHEDCRLDQCRADAVTFDPDIIVLDTARPIGTPLGASTCLDRFSRRDRTTAWCGERMRALTSIASPSLVNFGPSTVECACAAAELVQPRDTSHRSQAHSRALSRIRPVQPGFSSRQLQAGRGPSGRPGRPSCDARRRPTAVVCGVPARLVAVSPSSPR